jgi:hypothetical protein
MPKEPPSDVHVAGDPAETAALDAKAAQATERALNDSDRLKALEDENARLREKQAKYDKQFKEWVLGDYKNLPVDQPFEILVYTDDQPWTDPVIHITHNGHDYAIERGKPTRVPKYVVDLLNDARVTGVQQLVIDGTTRSVGVDQPRYPFAAHPIY